MPTPRKYAGSAHRQKAYRERLKISSCPRIPACPGKPRWRALTKQAEALLQAVLSEMEAYADERSEAWRESEKGEAFSETIEGLEEVLENLDDISQA